MWWMISNLAFFNGILFSASSGLISWRYQMAFVSCYFSKELRIKLPIRLLTRLKKMNLRLANYLINKKGKTIIREALRKSWRERFLLITPHFYPKVRQETWRIKIMSMYHPPLTTIKKFKRIDSVICWSAQSETSKLKILCSPKARETTIATTLGSQTHLARAPLWRAMMVILSKTSWYLKWQYFRSAKSRWKATFAIASTLIKHKDNYFKLWKRKRPMQQTKDNKR